ncbi:MAG TPA: hypothetical protein VJV77_06360 [Casimicrobiaceae bacterium]|nr:hypothetical protein [Casimicrobiaceae bacterium]
MGIEVGCVLVIRCHRASDNVDAKITNMPFSHVGLADGPGVAKKRAPRLVSGRSDEERHYNLRAAPQDRCECDAAARTIK